MKLIFERSASGRRTSLIPDIDVPETPLDFAPRAAAPRLPELSEVQVDRHYTELARETRGVNGGFPAGLHRRPSPAAGRGRAGLPGGHAAR